MQPAGAVNCPLEPSTCNKVAIPSPLLALSSDCPARLLEDQRRNNGEDLRGRRRFGWGETGVRPTNPEGPLFRQPVQVNLPPRMCPEVEGLGSPSDRGFIRFIQVWPPLQRQ